MDATRIGIVADDLTGAADTGIGFTRAGFAVVLYAEPPRDPSELSGEVITIDTDTRAGSAAAARTGTARTVGALVERGVDVCYLKLDSMLRGHAAATVSAALDARGPDAAALVAPAFPATGRTTVGGCQRVDGEPLPIPPLPELFAADGRRVAHLDLTAVRDAALPELIAAHRRSGASVLVCDAIDEADLTALARAGRAEPGLAWVGSGGLAAALAPTLRRAGGTPPPARPVEVTGPILAAVGSMAPIAAAQVESLTAAGMTPVPVDAHSPDSPGERSSADRVGMLLRDGYSVVATLAAPPARTSGGDPRLATVFAERLAPHIGSAGALVMTGGDTARALLRAGGMDRLDLIDEIEPGVVLAVASDRDLPIVTKAGSFGDATTLTTAVRRLTNPEGPR